MEQTNHTFLDLHQYPKASLQIVSNGVRLPVTYKASWDDGFGARGWKLDVAIEDPEIIASTRETGQQINTSVFVHDILDHILSGFWVSGHRSEAMALIQLSKRTNSNPRPDYRQMVQEDILNGRVAGESLTTFLPKQLVELLPSNINMKNSEIIKFLQQKLGESKLSELLVERFVLLGKAGEAHATRSWKSIGLDPEKQTAIGIALQNLLVVIDSTVEKMSVNELKGFIKIDNSYVSFATQKKNKKLTSIENYKIAVI